MTTTTAKFETGKTYYTTWNEDTGREHMSRYTIQKRTAKTVVINGYRCKIHYLEYSNSEAVRFSRGTWILAKNVYNEEAQDTQNARDIAWLEIEREIRERAAELKAIEAERNEVLSTPTVSTEAQEIAINAEIELATAIKAHESSFWRVLATVKECRSYAEFCTGEAQWADRMIEDVDTRITEYPNDESLKEVRGEYLAEADNYRAQAQIALTQADTLETALANDSTLTAAQQSIISTATTTEQEENTMTTRDRYLAAKEVASVRHNFDNDRDEWYINGKRTNKKNAADTLKSYGLTLDTFKAEHEAYTNEQIAESARQMAIDDQAEHVGDKVAREVEACDDNDNVFALLPELDELNDVENFDDELNQPPIDTDKPVDDYGAKLAELQAKRDAAQAALLKAQEEHEAAENTLQKFLSDTAGDLATKLQSLKLDYSIKLVTKSGYSFTATDFSSIYVDAFDGGKMFAFTDWRRRKYARYDTPTQVDKVIDMLRTAIERGDKEFKFPTVDELNQPPIDDCAVTAEAQDAATAAEIYNAEFAELRSLSDVELWNEQSKARANKDERRLAIVNDALEEMWREELEAFNRLEAEPPKVPTCKEIFADLPADPNADKPNMARYITTATYVKHGQKTSLPSCSIGIRSTDFARAEKARLALKAALDGLDGTEIDIVTDPHIDLYPIDYNSDDVNPVYHVDELDGTEDDAEDTLAIDVMPIDDSDDDELIDAPEIVDKTALEDSLTRAMKIALERLQAFCRAKNLTGASNELKLYNICSKAISELWGR